MKTADFSKLFLAIMMVYIFVTFCGCSMSLSKVMTGDTILSPKKPNQKWAKCCMKARIRQVFLKTSLFIVHFSKRCKRYLKTPSWTFFMKNQFQTDAFVAFVKPLSSVLSTSSMTTATWQRSLQQGF